MPSRTYISAEEKKMPGQKPMKDRLTLALCANASGDSKIKPLLVYHSKNPRAFKCLLCLDNAPAQPPGLEDDDIDQFKFIRVLYLPPNTTPILQPMDQQVLSNFKKFYMKDLFKQDFEGFSLEPEPVLAIEEDVEEIVSLGKSMGMEVHKDDITEFVEKHHEEITTEELKELHAMQNEEFQAQLSESEDIEEVIGRLLLQISTSTIIIEPGFVLLLVSYHTRRDTPINYVD
ncbi:tigger transposable element-derived protein 1-like [Palaemon carinicauda]|uniref:tigger transposable element-derived protein 1-like n=1 Tax=Palaemon carinicauda TaxID=392227 RepID=UPI0035B6A23F